MDQWYLFFGDVVGSILRKTDCGLCVVRVSS